MGRHALLAGKAIRCIGQPPLAEQQLGTLKNSADSDRELAFAFVAVVEARTVGLFLARDPGDLLRIVLPQCGQNGPSGQRTASKWLSGLVSSVKIGFCRSAVMANSLTLNIGFGATFVKVINAKLVPRSSVKIGTR